MFACEYRNVLRCNLYANHHQTIENESLINSQLMHFLRMRLQYPSVSSVHPCDVETFFFHFVGLSFVTSIRNLQRCFMWSTEWCTMKHSATSSHRTMMHSHSEREEVLIIILLIICIVLMHVRLFEVTLANLRSGRRGRWWDPATWFTNTSWSVRFVLTRGDTSLFLRSREGERERQRGLTEFTLRERSERH